MEWRTRKKSARPQSKSIKKNCGTAFQHSPFYFEMDSPWSQSEVKIEIESFILNQTSSSRMLLDVALMMLCFYFCFSVSNMKYKIPAE